MDDKHERPAGEEHLRRLEELFQGALERPADERAGWLAEACGADEGLRRRVEALLEQAAGNATLAPAVRFGAREGPVEPQEGPGSLVGRYKLLEQIGEGGFGTVYMAEQTEPVRRRVALKIVRLGMDTREVVARFEAERQALAIMDHPCIARVLDGGTTPSGRPYFVMELVRGVSITEWCDEHRATTQQRLALFVKVCQAVQHAHQKGVIHRDLKPGNVLVTMHDGEPVPKVIDFGVAKAIHSPLTEKTLFTAFGRFIGTPAYMSPEQAELSALDVDTRSDVWSLGVLLYELLTGSTPFDARRLIEEGLAAIQRTLREELPPRPSVRISTTGDAATAGRRGTDVPALTRRLRGDLDWIVMKCLEKERRRRYQAASELAADIERHLRDEPIGAGPPSRSYRLRKFLARNRLAVASGAAVLLALVIGIVGTSLGMLEASRQRDEAVQARLAAEQEAARTAAVTGFLVDTLSMADPAVALDANVSLASVLQRASGEIDQAFTGQPEGEARVRMTIGHAFKALGENELAERQLRQAIALAERADSVDGRALYEALWSLTHVLFTLERPDAMSMAQRARRVAHDLVRRSHPRLAEALDGLNDTAIDASMSLEPDAMERVPQAFERTVRLSDEELAQGDPLWPLVADSWIAAGYIVWYTPLDPLCEDLFRRAVLVLRREVEPNDPRLGEAVGLLVDALNRLGKAAEAEREMRETVRLMRAVLPEGTPQLAMAESMLGESLATLGRFQEAESLLVRAHEVFVASVGDVTNFLVAESFRRVLSMYAAWGREEETRRYRAQLLELCAAAESLMPWGIVRLVFDADQAPLAAAAGRLEEICGTTFYTTRTGAVSVEAVREPVAELVALLDARPRRDDELGVLLARQMLAWARTIDPEGSSDVRGALVERALPLVAARTDTIPQELADAHALSAEVLWQRGEHERAREEARIAADLVRGREQHWIEANAMVRVGRTLLRQGLLDEAEELLVPAHASLVEHFGPQNSDADAARALLSELYTLEGRPQRASSFALTDPR